MVKEPEKSLQKIQMAFLNHYNYLEVFKKLPMLVVFVK